jgi:iron complex outermembrane receptor protein
MLTALTNPGRRYFPGFRPENAVDESRTSGAVYLSAEADITDNFLVEAAGRYESYSDFGETANGKLSARYSLFDKMLSIRASASTGFAHLHYIRKYFSSVSTFFVPVQGQLYPFDVATVTNNSRAARAFGIPELKEETSTSITAGLTSKITENTLVTVDAYQIDIDDRIVLSGLFTPFDPLVAELLAGIPGADAAQFSRMQSTPAPAGLM